MTSLDHLPTTSGIYLIICKMNQKVYIGQASNLKKRILLHFRKLNRGKHSNPNMQNSYDSHGIGSFEVEVLELLDPSLALLDEKETYWISLYREQGFTLFSVAPVGGSILGLKRSEETRAKLKKARRLRPPPSEETKQKIGKASKGNQYAKGHHLTEEHKEALRQANLGNQYTLGYHHTEEAKLRIGQGSLGRRPALGLVHTEETKKKISEASKRMWARRKQESDPE